MNFMHPCELLHAHNEKFYRGINYFRGCPNISEIFGPGGPNIMGVQIFHYSAQHDDENSEHENNEQLDDENSEQCDENNEQWDDKNNEQLDDENSEQWDDENSEQWDDENSEQCDKNLASSELPDYLSLCSKPATIDLDPDCCRCSIVDLEQPNWLDTYVYNGTTRHEFYWKRY